MNLKVSHLVAVQFGIFIGLVPFLVFSRFESARPRTAAEMREPATERAATVERMSEPEDELADMADDRGELEPAESLAQQPLPNEYSPEAVEKSMAILTKLYYEQIAPRRPARTVAANDSNAAVAPSYTEVAPEPEVVQMDEPALETVAYVQPAPVIVYSPPVQFVAFSHPRRFVNRCRPGQHPGALASNSHRRRDRGGTQLSGLPGSRPPRSLGPGQRRTTGVPTCSSTQEFAARGKP